MDGYVGSHVCINEYCIINKNMHSSFFIGNISRGANQCFEK